MRMIVRLDDAEKQAYCVALGAHLKQLRAIAGYTQDDLADLSGISKERLSRIENGAFVMRWVQFVSLTLVFMMNAAAKEYLFALRLVKPRLLQALQMKDASVPPDTVVAISEPLSQEFNTDFKIERSLSSELQEDKRASVRPSNAPK